MTPATRQPMTVHPRCADGTLASASVYAPGTAVGERMAYAYGDLATGTVMYACHDQLGSVRRWRTPSKGNWGANEFEPYGEAYAVSTLAPRDYALHEWDPALAVYRAPYRNYSPTMTRWTTRDPLGMIDGPNMYGYVGGRTMNALDPAGLSCDNADLELQQCLLRSENEYLIEAAEAETVWGLCVAGIAGGCMSACALAALSGPGLMICLTICGAAATGVCQANYGQHMRRAAVNKAERDDQCYQDRINSQCEEDKCP